MKKAKKEHRTLEERAKEFGGRLGPYEEFDWGEPEGRETCLCHVQRYDKLYLVKRGEVL